VVFPRRKKTCACFIRDNAEGRGRRDQRRAGAVRYRLGDTLKMAQRRAYDAVSGIRFDGMQYRRDIGFRAVSPKR